MSDRRHCVTYCAGIADFGVPVIDFGAMPDIIIFWRSPPTFCRVPPVPCRTTPSLKLSLNRNPARLHLPAGLNSIRTVFASHRDSQGAFTPRDKRDRSVSRAVALVGDGACNRCQVQVIAAARQHSKHNRIVDERLRLNTFRILQSLCRPRVRQGTDRYHD